MELKNYMEDAVAETLREILAKDKDICSCQRCWLDMMALALNSLSPKYVVRKTGYVYAKSNELTTQFRVDILVAVMKAKELVSGTPRHDTKGSVARS